MMDEKYIKFTRHGPVILVDDLVRDINAAYPFKTIYGKKGEEIWAYDLNEGIWKQNGREIIETQTETLLGEFCKNGIVGEVLGKIKRITAISRQEFNKLPEHLILLKNGIWDQKAEKLIPFSETYYFKTKIPVSYDPKAKCPKIDKFIEDTFYPEDIPVIQEWMGFLLYKRYFIKKGIIVFGPKNTGKTIWLNLISAFVGEQNKAGLSLHIISRGDSFKLASLHNKLVNIYDDLKQQDLADTGGFKVAVGGGCITAEYKFGDTFEFFNYAKMTFSANKIPEIKEADDAYYYRWLAIPCDNDVPENEQDKFLLDKLTTDTELSGLLLWSLAGLKRLLDTGKFSYNKSSEEIKLIMEKHSNGLSAFIQDCLEESKGCRVPKEVMFEVYRRYCKEKNLQAGSETQLSRNLPLKALYVHDLHDTERYWGNVDFKKNQLNDKLFIDTLDTIQKIKGKVTSNNYVFFLEVSNPSIHEEKKAKIDTLDTFTKKEIKDLNDEPKINLEAIHIE